MKVKNIPSYGRTTNFRKNYNAHNSSFWIDEHYMSEDQDKTDVVLLASYKRAIANFVRIVTGKSNIPVTFSSGKDSYASESAVVISSKLESKDFDTTVGLALHEGSHILLTDYKFSKDAFHVSNSEVQRLYTKHNRSEPEYSIMMRLKTLCNIIEDRRIDKFIYDSAPGYRGYYLSLYNAHFNSKIIDQVIKSKYHNKVEWASYEFYLINLLNPNIDFSVLPGLREIAKEISVSTIDRLKSTSDSFNLSVKVYEMIYDILGWDSSSPKLNSSNNGEGPGDVNEDAEQESGGASKSSKDSEKYDSKSEKSESEESDDEAAEQEPEESEGEESSDDSDENDSGSDPNLDLPGASQDTSTAGGSEASSSLSAREQRALEKAMAKQKEFLNGKIQKSKLRNKRDIDTINALAEANSDFIEVGGNVDYIDRHGAKSKIRFEKTKCMVLRGFSEQLLEGGSLSYQYRTRRSKNISPGDDYVASGIALGIQLGKRLKTRDENRDLKTTRISKGRIDKRLLSELGFGNEKVFSETAHFSVTPSVIHISVDASGSMCGKKWVSAMRTAVAIAKAATMVESLQCIISIRGQLRVQTSNPLMWIVYDSKVDSFAVIKKHFLNLDPSASTPEGLCFEAALKEVRKASAGRDSYFINLSDGQPAFSIQPSNSKEHTGDSSYHGLAACYHTKHQIDAMRKSNVKVLSYFVSDHSPESSSYKSDADAFTIMYGADSKLINVENLSILANTLNQLFIRNNE